MVQRSHRPRAFRGVQFTFHSQLFDELIATDTMERFLGVPAYEKVPAIGGLITALQRAHLAREQA